MSSTTTRSLSFRPWAHDAIDDVELKDVLQRVNLERGHFRDITEASLQEEIATEGALELSDSDNDDDDDDDTNNNGSDERAQPDRPGPRGGAPTTREELYKAKGEMLQHVSSAEQDILMALDFVSLLESKYEVGRATSTISPVLKTTVPTGSLGADIWHRTPPNPGRDAQESALATNVRLAGLRQSADDLCAAAARLRENVRREERYWEQIRSISEQGWNVLRLPRQPHLLGVHFGFRGSTSVVGKRDVAALLTDKEGNISLERGLGAKPKALRAVVRREGKVVGSSVVPAFPEEDETTLEARIRFARDSVFDEELYHEMIREGRLLAAMGVTTRGSAITFQVRSRGDGPDISVSLELISTNERRNLESSGTQELDSVAHSVVLALRLFLSYAHREKLQQKPQLAPPMREKKDDQAVLRIIRPLISVMRHLSLLVHLNSYVDGIVKLLQLAQVDCTCQHGIMASPTNLETTGLQELIKIYVGSLTTGATITIKPPKGDPLELKIGLETSPMFSFGSGFSLSLPPQREHRFINTEDLVAGVDGLLASTLAKSLHGMLGTGWKVSEREALVRQTTGTDDRSHSIKVVVDTAHKAISLKSASEEVTWKSSLKADISFWQAWKRLTKRSDTAHHR